MTMPVDMMKAVADEMPDASEQETLQLLWGKLSWLPWQERAACVEMITLHFKRNHSLLLN